MAGDTQDPLTPNEWCKPPRGAGIYSLLGLKQRSVFKGNRVALKNFTPEHKLFVWEGVGRRRGFEKPSLNFLQALRLMNFLT